MRAEYDRAEMVNIGAQFIRKKDMFIVDMLGYFDGWDFGKIARLFLHL